MAEASAELKRAIAFVHAIEERSYTRREPWRDGTAFFHDRSVSNGS
ncbi:MAG: hypothetical protein ACRDLB_14655 [Actinomycetota bacterium]